MKIIFLDIDGVLNSFRYDLHRGDGDSNIDVSRLVLINRLIARTDAKIVLTSSWRSHWDPDGIETDSVGAELEWVFEQNGISLYDKTPMLDDDRAREVSEWLNEHLEVDAFVIFDDIKLGWGALDPYVVKTDYRIGNGLEQTHIDKAEKILLAAED